MLLMAEARFEAPFNRSLSAMRPQWSRSCCFCSYFWNVNFRQRPIALYLLMCALARNLRHAGRSRAAADQISHIFIPIRTDDSRHLSIGPQSWQQFLGLYMIFDSNLSSELLFNSNSILSSIAPSIYLHNRSADTTKSLQFRSHHPSLLLDPPWINPLQCIFQCETIWENIKSSKRS